MDQNAKIETNSSLPPISPMTYLSTRGDGKTSTFMEVLMSGLAGDGGLAVPSFYPAFTPQHLEALSNLSYSDLAYEIVSRFATDIDPADLRKIVDATYTVDAFQTQEITPLERLNGLGNSNLWKLGLSNGPSLAFKDVALSLLGELFSFALSSGLHETGSELNIVGATSGDTGGAAIYAMRGRRGIKVFMMSPKGKTSPFQAGQMYSVLDENIHNIAIEGVFDDCQDIVKAISDDFAFKNKYKIGTVNSINWARVMAQVVYYFKGYFALREQMPNAKVAFSIPSGNFGNIFAGFVATKMGLPVERLILATNENNVLDEFFTTGRYRPRGSENVSATSSPSMDISKASNFERFVYHLVNNDGARVRELYSDPEGFDLSGSEEFARIGDYKITSGSSTHANRIATIAQVHEKCGKLIDPHTADGIKVAQDQAHDLDAQTQIICLETALPVKFSQTIDEALVGVTRSDNIDKQVQEMLKRDQRVVVLNNDVAQVKEFIASKLA